MPRNNILWLAKIINKRADLAINEALLAVQAEVRKRTPVRFGGLRAAWRFEIEGKGYVWAEPVLKDEFFSETITLKYTLKDNVILFNPQPYAKKIERGTSRQAPSGILAAHTQLYKEIFERTFAAVMNRGVQ